MAKITETSELGLKRALGLLDTVSIEVGGIIGAGIFALTGMAIGMCGAAVPIAFLIAALPMIFAIIPLGMLASALPTVGGSFRYPSRIVSPFWGFIGVWGIMMGILLGGLPLYAYTFADYLLILFPSLPRVAVAVTVLTFFFLVNIVGIRTAGSIQVVMFVILMIALLTYIGGGLPNIELSNLTPMFSQGFMGIATAGGLLFFAYMGANFIIDLGAEIKNARRNIPLSFALSIPIVIVVYTLIGMVDVGVVPCELTANQPLSVSAGKFLPGPLATFFTVGGGLLAMATTLNATFMFGARYILVFADNEVVPRRLAAVSNRFATPHWGLLLMFLVSLLAIPLGTSSLTIFGITASIGSITLLIPILIAAFLLPRKMPQIYEKAAFKIKGSWLWLLPALAILFGIFFVIALGIESPLGFTLFIVWMAFGILYYFLRSHYLKNRRGIGLEAIAKKRM